MELCHNPTIATQILDCRAFDLPATTTALLRTCDKFWAARPQLNYCELATDFGLRDDNRTIANLRKILDCATTIELFANFRQISGCAATTKLLQTCKRFWIAELLEFRATTTFELLSQQTAGSFLLLGAQLVHYKTTLSPSRFWCAQRQIQPTCGPETNDSAIAPNAAWSAWND